MSRIYWVWILLLSPALVLAAESAGAITCPRDAVPVGPLCVDKYEASVWSVPDPTTRNRKLVSRIKRGSATLEDLVAGGAVQHGCGLAPFEFDAFPENFPKNGNWAPLPGSDPPTPGVYAASVPGVLPSTCTTWFQAAQACRLSDKRLLTNAEWQDAASGTPDPGTDDESTDCNILGPPFEPSDTGSRSACASNWGAFDMVGNAFEWVSDWVPKSTACPGWGAFSDDFMCLAGALETWGGPGALIRGGSWHVGRVAGVFAIFGLSHPSSAFRDGGLRCAR
jgi:formylglycine-generating enzyme required for sulfatase activity